jgi:hypothetical protein
MTSEASHFLAKARRLLAHADIMLYVGLSDAAARTASLADLHTAQAFLLERVGSVYKGDRRVLAAFLRLTKDDPRIAGAWRVLLSRAMTLATVVDCETGPRAAVPAPRATAALEDARRFVTLVEGLLAPPPAP